VTGRAAFICPAGRRLKDGAAYLDDLVLSLLED
jgi:hypothetical protein